MDPEIERKVRERAYSIWEEEGRPQGKDRQHWERAAQLVAAELASAGAKPMRRDRARDGEPH
jgi:hypothetical protein